MRIEHLLRGVQQRREKLDLALTRVTEQLVSLGAVRIVLFGSLAHNQTHEYSDLDLLVVMPSIRTGKEWADLLYEQVDRQVAADLVVYSAEEYAEMLPRSAFLQGIESSGRVIHDAER